MLALFPLLLAALALAAPSRVHQTIPLVRNTNLPSNSSQKGQWARRQADILMAKYASLSPNSPSKRSSGFNDIVNHNQDSSYFGSLAVGTPATAFNVILDTGSSDLWIAGDKCTQGCHNIPLYAPTHSSSFKNLTTPFKIQYGSGAALGTLVQDSVQMAGFSVPSQTFAVVEAATTGLLTTPVSGLIGLAFQNIASSNAVPFWETLAKSNVWDEPVMSFFLTRFINSSSANAQEPGGRFTMGYTDSTLYQGDIDFVNIPQGQEGYWILPMTTLSVQGQNISLTTAANSFSAIDTGTTLIGGPPAIISQIFEAIPGSQPGTGDYEGYYTYPCSTTVHIELSFGSRTWPITPSDFLLTQLTEDQCLGAFFQLEMGNGSPSWIVGDTFLKNVYSVFRFDPPSVGFADLSSRAEELSIVSGALPSPTLGSNPTTATVQTSSNAARSIAFRSFSLSSLISLSGIAIASALFIH